MPNNVHWLDDRELKAWRCLLRGHGELLRRLDRELVIAHELCLADYEVLVHLSETPKHQLRMTELARSVLLSPSGLTRRLDTLVKRALVERRPCASDGRGQMAVLTSAGLAKLEEMAPTHVRGVREHLIDRLSQDQLSALIEIFTTLAGHDKTSANGVLR